MVHVGTAVRVLTHGRDYQVHHNTGNLGGYVKLYSASGVTDGRLYISRRLTKEQRQHWNTQRKLTLPYVEGAADRLNQMLQDMGYQVSETNKKTRYRGLWATGRYHYTADLTRSGLNLYIATTEHVAGTSLAADVTAGNQLKFFDGDAVVAAWYTLPTISGGDANKVVRVNSGETDIELSHLVPKPASGGSGKIPIPNIGETDYEGFFDRNPIAIRPKFTLDPAAPKNLYWYLHGRFNHHEWGPLYTDPQASANYMGATAPVATSTWAYLYITGLGNPDIYGYRNLETTITGSDDFEIRTDVPTYSAEKGGWYWYDSSAGKWYQAIFPVYLDGSGDIRPFQHETSNGLVWWHDSISEYNASHPAAWTTTGFTGGTPPVCDRILAELVMSWGSGSAKYLWYRRGSSTAATGHRLLSLNSAKTWGSSTRELQLNSSRQADFRIVNGPAQAHFFTNGFYLPKGM